MGLDETGVRRGGGVEEDVTDWARTSAALCTICTVAGLLGAGLILGVYGLCSLDALRSVAASRTGGSAAASWELLQ